MGIGRKLASRILVSLLAAPLLSGQLAAAVILTVAGGGSVGDEGAATAANLNFPAGLALDVAQNLYIADETGNTIRRVDRATGVISAVVGNGLAGFSPDGTPAGEARLNNPVAVAIDTTGNVYIADRLNHRIRRLDATAGTVSTIAGTGVPGYSGDNGPAAQAQLKFPVAVAVNRAGDVFIADQYNHRIRKVSASTGLISTVVGTGEAGYSGEGLAATASALNTPNGVAVDITGAIFIADKLNQRVRRVDPATGLLRTVAGTGTVGYAGDGGPATAARLWNPANVSWDLRGNLYVVDEGNGVVRRIARDTKLISTVAGNGGAGFGGDGGPATAATFNMTTGLSSPGIVLDNRGNLFVADRGNQRIRRIDAATLSISTYAGGGPVGDGQRARRAHLAAPTSITKDAAGNLYIADRGNNLVRKVDGATFQISTIAGAPAASGYSGDGGPAHLARCNLPIGVLWDAGNLLYVVEEGNHVVRRIDLNSGIVTTVAGSGKPGNRGDGGPATQARLRNPHGVALDAQKNIYIADSYNNVIRRVDAVTGVISRAAGTGAAGASGDSGLAVNAELNTPYNIAIRDSQLYIADFGNNVVRRVDLVTGIITRVAGTWRPAYAGDGGPARSADLWHPSGIAFDSTGAMLIADYGNNVVRRVEPVTQRISTIVGTGIAGFAGDGGAPAVALLNLPVNLFVDANDVLYINDVANNRVRAVVP